MKSPLPGWGINLTADDLTSENIPAIIDSIRRLRFGWVRFEFDFRQSTNPEVEKKFLSLCRRHHIKVLGLFNYFVPGAIQNIFVPSLFHLPIISCLESFNDYVANIVGNYSKYISHWEILNEPNTIRFWVKRPDHREYLQVLQKTAAIIRHLQPTASIVFGGIMGNDDTPSMPFQEKRFFQKCLEKGANLHFSIANFHPYTTHSYFSLASFQQQLKLVKNSMEKAYKYAKGLGQKKIWFTEFGISNTIFNRLSSNELAAFYFQLYHWCRRKKIVIFLWTLHDLKVQKVSPLNPEAYFGLLDRHLHPKPAYNTLVSLMNRVK